MGKPLCVCQPGFQGFLCQHKIDYCDSMPCKHGATCTNTPLNYSCTCTPYHTGDDCSKRKNISYNTFTHVKKYFYEFCLLEAVKYSLDALQKLILYAFVITVITIIVLLCAMDLPWNGIIIRVKARFADEEEETEEEREQRELNENGGLSVQEQQIAQDEAIAKEKEILKKLQHTMTRSKTGVDFQLKQRQDTMLF
jgi:hypothetical protein